MTFDAIVLAGGEGRRLGGTDKAELTVARGRLLDVVVEACAGARRTIVVGAARPSVRPVIWTCEDPPGQGPCAALVAGLAHVTAPTVVLLAVDLPHLSAALVDALASAAPVVGVDADDREQWLLSAWPASALADLPVAGALRHALGPREHTTMAVGTAAHDIDTPADLQAACARGAC